jgi:hypothetical protein
VLPGGVANPDKLRLSPESIAFIRAFSLAGKIIGAICHGPWTLIDAGVVTARHVTSWPSLKQDLINAGAEWTDEEVVVDMRLVTSRKPDDLPAFNDALLKELLMMEEDTRPDVGADKLCVMAAMRPPRALPALASHAISFPLPTGIKGENKFSQAASNPASEK